MDVGGVEQVWCQDLEGEPQKAQRGRAQKAQKIRDAELLRRGIAAKERRDRKRGRGVLKEKG